MKTCPYCAEQIQDAAIVCRYCGHDLNAAGNRRDSSAAGKTLKRVATVLYYLVGIYGLLVGLLVVAHDFGIGTAVAGFFLFPVVIVLAPWYLLLVYGGWIPLVVTYGGGILAAVLSSYGEKLARSG